MIKHYCYNIKNADSDPPRNEFAKERAPLGLIRLCEQNELYCVRPWNGQDNTPFHQSTSLRSTKSQEYNYRGKSNINLKLLLLSL